MKFVEKLKIRFESDSVVPEGHKTINTLMAVCLLLVLCLWLFCFIRNRM